MARAWGQGGAYVPVGVVLRRPGSLAGGLLATYASHPTVKSGPAHCGIAPSVPQREHLLASTMAPTPCPVSPLHTSEASPAAPQDEVKQVLVPELGAEQS